MTDRRKNPNEEKKNSFGSVITSAFDLPGRITAEYFDSLDPFSREAIWQLCYRDLNSYDFRIDSPRELSQVCFNSETCFPDAVRDMADRVMQDGKKHILGDTSLTGKGIKVAVIDRPINKDHIEFRDRIEYVNVAPDHPDNEYADFHGMVCASFLSGSSCGVAPGSELVYFAIPNETNDLKRYYSHQLSALEKIVRYNETSPSPIRVVSLSAPFLPEQKEARDALADKLEKTRCALIDATVFGRSFQGIDFERFSPDPSFVLNGWQTENYENNKDRPGFTDYFSSLCFVPSTRRTSAANDTNDSYIHWSKTVSESWTIPHVAGVYALCLQKCTDLRFEVFIAKCKKCERKNGYIVLNTDLL